MKRVGLYLDRTKSCSRDVLDGVASFLDELPPDQRWECWFENYLNNPDVEPPALDGALATLAGARDAQRLGNAAPAVVRVLGSTSLKSPWPIIVCDDHAVGAMAARELLSRGHRDLAFIANAEGRSFGYAMRRMAGFREEAERAGARFHFGPIDMSLRQFLRSLPHPCGAMAINDESGKFVLDACRVENIRVPHDLAVMGVDNDLHHCELSWPPLASVRAGHFEVGYRAAQRLHAMMLGSPIDAPHIETAGVPEVVVRASIDTMAVRDELVARALVAIKTHAHEPLNVADLCERLGVGRRSLEQRFRRATGKSLLQELHLTRIQMAKRLLGNRRLSVEKIAELCGFRTHSHMGTIFRQIVGTPPTAYRRRATQTS